MSFEDHFSTASENYRRHRPDYPRALYEWLVERTPGCTLAWDCATGQGQAAVALAEWFEKVVATDGSPEQLDHVIAHPRVVYRRALAHNSGLETSSVDLITIASALHWFATDAFYREAQRVLRPGGMLAAWSYGAVVEICPEIDRLVQRFADETLQPFWPDAFGHVRSRYQNLHFPFGQVEEPPTLSARMSWTAAEFVGHLRSWSGYQRCLQMSAQDPLPDLAARVTELWGPDRREVRWPLHFRIAEIT